MSKQKKGETAKRPNRLPGRVYTLIVTALAVVLVGIPLFTLKSRIWTTVAVVEHPPIGGWETAESIVFDQFAASIKQAPAVASPASAPSPEELRSRLQVATANGSTSQTQRTTIQLRHADRQLTADLVSTLARELAASTSQGDHAAAVISIESSDESRLGRRTVLSLFAFAFCFGAITTLFPRPRQSERETAPASLERVEEAAGIPILGSVFPSGKHSKKKQSSSAPLRFTVLLAETIVAAAFLLTLYSAATDADFTSRMLGSPLDAYAQSVHSVGVEFQSVRRR